MTARALELVTLTVVLAVAVSGAACATLRGGATPIHDITTDMNDPPAFVDVLPLRAGASNSGIYGGSAVAALQLAAYPDIVPADLAMTPAAAFAKSHTIASKMGWALVSVDSSSGRIEATATTRWFRFKDDVVIRVRPREGGSRVDLRSVSRIGKSDWGKNAARIRDFIKRLRAPAPDSP